MWNFQVSPLGDQGIRIEFANIISPKVNKKVHQFVDVLEQKAPQGIVEIVPAYSTVTVCYQPLVIGYEQLVALLEEQLQQLSATAASQQTRKLTLPVFYGGESGPDLDFVAGYNGLSREEVVSRHTSRDYLAYMIGFTPGFPYLGGMDETIAVPRRSSPRKQIRAGSVGIAGSQTGIYSVASPAGWQIIGHTPVPLFDPYAENPVLIQAGDTIRFHEVSRPEYEEICSAVMEKQYILGIDYF
ncbi:inhibitor of KinA [Evansella caseinilytica]|uniref:Inhibitor of KinA n=1 Tax=Evansella caseinilytica TaxID=1503961 RepID=A0A1H3V1Z5_9BACI|nr:5-oxoprolinase subunit PxpB [Evansella caseinilytica]SDZ68241.1 inhibitor of KinA [Evansella caseinilytica]